MEAGLNDGYILYIAMEDTVLRINILDHDPERLFACEQAFNAAIRQLAIKAVVTQISEPPYLARMNVYDKLPALEIEGLIWSRKSSEAFTKDEAVRFLQRYCKIGN